MFDEANIKEVQTCLASLSSDAVAADDDPHAATAPGTPRSVVLFQQQAEESAGEASTPGAAG
eukprot:gene18471-17045_t